MSRLSRRMGKTSTVEADKLAFLLGGIGQITSLSPRFSQEKDRIVLIFKSVVRFRNDT
jgi:hypothetical protein